VVSACEQFQELLALDAVERLEPMDRHALEVHLDSGCAGCSELVRELRETVALLPYGLPPAPPAATTRERLLARVRPEGAVDGRAAQVIPIARARGRSRRLWVATTAFALAAAVFAGLWWRTREEVEQARAELVQREAYYRDQLRKQDRKYAILRSPNLRTVDMRGESGGIKLDTRVFIDQEHRTWLLLSYRLPQLPSDKDYELWFFNGQKPVRAGILSQDPEEPTHIEVPPDLPEITATAVTIEPKGGLPQPSGPVVMKSDL